MTVIECVAAVVGLVLAALLALRWRDRRADALAWSRLAAMRPANPKRFDPAMLDGLPEPAQRYFRFTVTPDAPLLPVAEIDMQGQLGLGNGSAPRYQSMRARQILAVPHGFVWQVEVLGRIPLSGSDAGSLSNSWTRFRLLGLIPVARLGGNTDHLRSAFGRYVAEAAFWTPAALLPGPGVQWQAVDGDTARATVTAGSLSQAVDIRVEADGRPAAVSLMRWSNANADGVYRLQPFGGELADFRRVRGYRLPFRVEGGNLFGTDDYFPFFKAEVIGIRLLGDAQ